MIKLFKLTKNELVKQLHKKATWVMLALLPLLAIGSTLLYGTVQSAATLDLFYGSSLSETLESEKAYFEEALRTTSKYDGETQEYYRTRIEYYALLIEAGVSDFDDWRYTSDIADIAAEALIAEDQQTYSLLRDAILNNDSDPYYVLQKQLLALTPYSFDQQVIYEWGLDYCIEHDVRPDEYNDWRYAAVQNIVNNRLTILEQALIRDNGGAWSEAVMNDARDAVLIDEYRLTHDMPTNPADSFASDSLQVLGLNLSGNTGRFWNVMSGSTSLISVVSLFVIIIAGSIVSSEFSSGSIKFLLISPVKRWKLLLSKYLTILLAIPVMLAVLFLFSFFPALLFGARDAFLPALTVEDGVLLKVSPYLLLLRDYALATLEVVLMSTLAFALSSLLRSSALAIGVSIFLDMAGELFVSLLALFGADWGRYLLFANLDFPAIASGNSLFPHQSLALAIVIVVCHMAVFLWTAWDAFTKRDV